MIKLYDAALSGNCHKVRLMLSLLGLDYQIQPINLMQAEQKNSEYLAMNPLGQVPTLDDDGEVLRDSQAILVYLAAKYGNGQWLPGNDPVALGHVMEWLSFSANEMLHGCAVSRALVIFKRQGDLEGAREKARTALGILNDHLATSEWLVGTTPSVADVANYVYAGLIHEGGIDPHEFTHVSAWLARVEALDSYVGMAALPGPKA
jgi:glutathione S-transferase